VIGPLVGMVHLGPLLGAARYAGGFDRAVAAAVADAVTLEQAGFDALLVENLGDAPFFADDVPKITVAAMATAVSAVSAAVEIPVGVNVLRNDALAALAVAAATGGRFIRVNVLTGMMTTDQGPIAGRAAEVARARAAWGAAVEIAADVMVKHAVPPPGLTLAAAARDTWERGGADALVVSGPATGEPIAAEHLTEVRSLVPDAPLLVGSGATAGNAAELLAHADGLIVGTSIKVNGVTTAPVDPIRARGLATAARG
jgi:membrane complex biogenesis BtpA family protein